MKTNKLNTLALATTLLLLASCKHEDITKPSAQTYTPEVQATMGQLTSVNVTPGSENSRVVEDNPDYALGEKFYWVNGDQVKMLFFEDGNLAANPIELTYTAVVPDGTKPNSCGFTTEGSVPAGNYTVYGLFPAGGWSKGGYGYTANMPNLTQSDASSKHLGQSLFMKAKATNISISGGGNNSIDLSFKHLSSVVRFHITDNTRPTPLKLGWVELGIKNYGVWPETYVKFWPNAAYLQGGIDDNSLTPIATALATGMFVDVVQNFIDKGATREFDVFMPVLPTGAPTDLTNHKLYILSTVSYEDGGYMYSHQQDFGTTNGLSFVSDIPFLQNGFEAGKSYYFNLKTWPKS